MPKIIPYGDRMLVKRRKVGEKIGEIYLSDNLKDSSTDLADVVHIPDNSFADKELLDKAEEIIHNLSVKASEGDSDALISLLRFNDYLKIKSIKVGDAVMVSKYVGIDFMDGALKENLTLVNSQDIIGLIVKEQ